MADFIPRDMLRDFGTPYDRVSPRKVLIEAIEAEQYDARSEIVEALYGMASDFALIRLLPEITREPDAS